ncbi:MAG: PAS domain S-box protein [Calditrichia bacterium]
MDFEINSLELFRGVFASAPAAMLIVTNAGTIVQANEKAAEVLKYPQKKLKGKSIDTLLSPAEYDSPIDQLIPKTAGSIKVNITPGKGPGLPGEVTFNSLPEGEYFLLTLQTSPLPEKNLSEEKFRLAVNAAPNGILIVDSSGKITFVNSTVEKYFGYSAAELIGMKVEMLIPKDMKKEHVKFRKQYLKSLESRPMGMGRELFGLRKNGTVFPLEIGLNPVVAAKGTEIIVVVVDITLRRKLEEEQKILDKRIQRSQKYESLSVLAGGIAHDFNNLLTGVLGNADLALLILPPESTVRDYISSIQKSALRAADLSKQMLAYSGQGNFIIQPLDLNKIIEEMTHLLRVSISNKTVINYKLYPGLPAVEGDVNQIRQIVMNLITNASEAIGDKSGIITINTGAMECDVQYLTELSLDKQLEPGIYVYLEIADTGCGMNKETQARIFDPFYTTKFSGRGLGLAAVEGIIRNHGGAIKVYSEINRGTTFKLLFPCSAREAVKFTEESVDFSKLKGEGKVLVIDDEDTVRALARKTLEGAGFQVITSNDGREGLKIFNELQHELTLILLDLVMPHLHGEQVFQKVHRARPEIPVIIMSGYHEQEISNRFTGRQIAGFIQKPLRPKILLQKILIALADQKN